MNALHEPTMAELQAGLEKVRQSPKDQGRLEMIVRRPKVNAREVLAEGMLDHAEGLVGDGWRLRLSPPAAGASPDTDTQIAVINTRLITLVAQTKERWALAGDQLFLDMDLSAANLPPGARLSLGDAVVEVTDQPHTGCRKFVARYGADAMRFVNSEVGIQLRLRGMYVKVVQPGTIRVGDIARKIEAPPARPSAGSA
jgi:hypothetical protein